MWSRSTRQITKSDATGARDSELISQGLTNQEIADALVIELGTVKNHVHNVLSRMSTSRKDAALYLLTVAGRDDVDTDESPVRGSRSHSL
ncbi:MAG: helix-turn-helix transcriptional regulator [Caldilineaceae bacterium]|nr:helix-turn-helix transcriptional regulator [Caldilineaceae bacterium]